MLCCVGLFGGLAVGQALGGPWTVVAPAVGFAAGLAGDMKLMKGMHKHSGPQPAQRAEAKPDSAASRSAVEAPQTRDSGTGAASTEHGSCCGVASANGNRRAWLIGGAALAALAIFASWDWIDANGLAPFVVILAFAPLVFVCMRGHGTQAKGKREMSLADIRKTYETDSAEPPRPG